MGYDRSHAIVVTSWSDDRIAIAHQHAQELCGQDLVSPLVERRVNGGASFLIAPDGSKEGWEDSDVGDQQRESLIRWLDRQRHVDGSTPYDWIYVQFGDDERQNLIVRASDDDQASATGELP